MGIIFGIYMLAGIVAGLTISVILGGLAGLVIFVTRLISTRRGQICPVFAITMALVLPVLVIGVYGYPLPSIRPGNDYDIACNNFFLRCLGYSASLGGAALCASVVTFVMSMLGLLISRK